MVFIGLWSYLLTRKEKETSIIQLCKKFFQFSPFWTFHYFFLFLVTPAFLVYLPLSCSANDKITIAEWDFLFCALISVCFFSILPQQNETSLLCNFGVSISRIYQVFLMKLMKMLKIFDAYEDTCYCWNGVWKLAPEAFFLKIEKYKCN